MVTHGGLNVIVQLGFIAAQSCYFSAFQQMSALKNSQAVGHDSGHCSHAPLQNIPVCQQWMWAEVDSGHVVPESYQTLGRAEQDWSAKLLSETWKKGLYLK